VLCLRFIVLQFVKIILCMSSMYLFFLSCIPYLPVMVNKDFYYLSRIRIRNASANLRETLGRSRGTCLLAGHTQREWNWHVLCEWEDSAMAPCVWRYYWSSLHTVHRRSPSPVRLLCQVSAGLPASQLSHVKAQPGANSTCTSSCYGFVVQSAVQRVRVKKSKT